MRWQDSKVGKYIEYKINVFYQEGPGSKKFVQDSRNSLVSNDVEKNIYRWEIYKRYSNFVDLSEALLPYFRAENLEPPLLPPKIEFTNDKNRNQNLTDRKR